MSEEKMSKDYLENLYWNQKLSSTEIGKKLGLHHTTVLYWMKKFGISRRSRSDAVAIACGTKPDLRPTSNLSYILGVMLGDGYTSYNKAANSYKIILSTVTKPFAESFLEALTKIGLNPRISIDRWVWNGRWQFRLVAYSAIFYNWFNHLSIEEIESIVTKSKEHMMSFIRGFYESEGCYFLDRGKYRRIFFSNLDLEIMNLINEILHNLGFRSRLRRSFRDGRYEYTIGIYWQKETEAFMDLIKPCIKRGD